MSVLLLKICRSLKKTDEFQTERIDARDGRPNNLCASTKINPLSRLNNQNLRSLNGVGYVV